MIEPFQACVVGVVRTIIAVVVPGSLLGRNVPIGVVAEMLFATVMGTIDVCIGSCGDTDTAAVGVFGKATCFISETVFGALLFVPKVSIGGSASIGSS